MSQSYEDLRRYDRFYIMNNLVIITHSDDIRLKKRLQKIIAKKRSILEKITSKIEVLEMDLDFVKYEYDSRIGRLTLRDNQLDLEIIRAKNVKRLLDEGKTYEEATAEVEDTYYSEQLAFDREQERIAYEEKVLEGHKGVPDTLAIDMRSLWKKLIVQYHPDLVMDREERQKREEITKQINKAYRERDFDALQLLDSGYAVERLEDFTVEKLETIIVDLESKIVKANGMFLELRYSQWYRMKVQMDHATKKGIDIFRDLEKKLLDDVLRKIEILKLLKREIGEFI